jgi:hypothetical protein
MTTHEADCAFALERLLRFKTVLPRQARRFVSDMAHLAHATEAHRATDGWTLPLTDRQSRWLFQLVSDHAKSRLDPQLVADARTLLRRQTAA